MSDFDPADVISITHPATAKPAARDSAPHVSSDFDLQDVIAVHPAQAAASDFDKEDVLSLQHPEPQHIEPQKPSGPQGQLVASDIQKIAQKHGVDPAELSSIASYYSTKEPESGSLAGFAAEGAKQALGTGGRILAGLPQLALKKLHSDPKMRAAIDELTEIGEGQRGLIEKTTEVLGLPGSTGAVRAVQKGASTLGKLAKGAAEGAGFGAAFGLGSSKEGQEAQSAGTGAVLGAGIGTGAAALSKLLEKSGGATELAHLELQPKNVQMDIEKGVQEIADRTAESESALEDMLLSHKAGMNRDEVETILKQQMPEESLSKYMDASTPEGQAIRRKLGVPEQGVGHDVQDEIQRELVNDLVNRRVQQFAEDLNGKATKDIPTAYDLVAERLSKEPEYVAQRYKDFVQTQQAQRFLEDTGSRVESQHGFYGKAGNFISDSQYVLRDIDNRVGTDLEKVLREGNKAYNKSTYVLKEYRGKLDQVFRNSEKLGVANQVAHDPKIYEALQNPELFAQLSPEEQKAAQGIRDFFQDFHEFQTQKIKERDPDIAPLPTGKLENYVPHYAKPTAEIIPMVEKKWDQSLGQLSQDLGREVKSLAELTPKEFAEASQGTLKELVDYAKWGNNHVPKGGAELNAYLNQSLYSRGGKQALDIVAKSSLERAGEIPNFLLEKNPFKLMSMYTANTIRGMYLRKFADQLRNRIGTLEKAGADVDADYVRKLVQDVQGSRPGTAAAANRDMKTSYYRQLDQLIDKAGGPDTFVGGRLTAAKAIPEILRELSLQIYPASMGLNFRSAIQNLTGSITKLAPEMGGVYGYRTLAKAALEASRNFASDLEKVRVMGNFPAGFIREGEAAIAEGLQATSLYQIPRKALNGMSSAMMVMHQLSENVNRVLSLRSGQIMGRELQEGSRAAQSALQRFPRSIQREVAQAPEQAGEIIAKYLNDTTQYNYNRLSMNEFGRSMGPMFSVFSKWPAATAGDMLATMREKGILAGSFRNLEKYVAPALLLHLVGIGLTGQRAEEMPGEGMSDREKLLTGSHGLVQGAPITNMISMAKGEVGVPPALAMGYQGIVKPALEGHAPSVRALAGQLTQSFMPGAGMLRFLTQDLVTLNTGHKPQGSDFFEKTDSGLKKLGLNK